MPLPKKYLALPSPAVATINYVDLAEGITIFNGYTTEAAGATNYGITTGYSYLVSTSGALGTNASFSGSFYTGELNRPLLLKGTAVVSMTWRVTNSTSSNNNFPFARLRKYDGTTTTQIGETSGSIVNSGGGKMRTTSLKIINIPSTLIKIGEQIEMNVGITGENAGNSPRGFIAHDPQNRADDWFTTGNFDTTKLIIGIPSKIQ